MSQEFGNLAHIFELCQLLLNILLTNFNLKLKKVLLTVLHRSMYVIRFASLLGTLQKPELVSCSAAIKILHKDVYCLCEMNNSLQPASVFRNSPDHVGFKY